MIKSLSLCRREVHPMPWETFRADCTSIYTVVMISGDVVTESILGN